MGIFERIFRMTINLFVYVWVARYLGPENFGLYNYSIAFVGLFGALATLGLDEIVVSRLVKEETKTSEIIGTAILLKLTAAFLLLLFITLILFATSEDQKTNVLILIVASSLIFQSFNIFDLFFQSKVLSRYVVYANLVTLTISSLIKIYLIFIKAKLIFLFSFF